MSNSHMVLRSHERARKLREKRRNRVISWLFHRFFAALERQTPESMVEACDIADAILHIKSKPLSQGIISTTL